MVITSPQTIMLKGDFIQSEFEANEILSPGHMVELLSTGKIQKNDTLGVVPKLFALEQEYDGKEITVDYAEADTVIVTAVKSGNEVYAKLGANAPAIVIGDTLVPVAGGTLAKSVEVVDLTDSTTGTANDTLVDVTSSFVQATLNDNFADLAAKVNAILPSGAQSPVAIALEAVDNSANGTEVFIKVLIV